MSIDLQSDNFQHWNDTAFTEKGLGQWNEYRKVAPHGFRGGDNALRPGTRLWYILSYDDVRDAYTNTDAFSNADYNTTDELKLKNFPLGIDPPDHGKYRSLIVPKFSPSVVKGYEKHVREFCQDLIAGIAPKGGCDFAEDFAMRFPTGVFLTFMGLPNANLPYYLEIARSMSMTPPDTEGYADIMAEGERKIIEIFTELLEERRRSPKDDLPSYFLSCEVDGRPLNQTELLSICVNLFRGGLDTMVVQLGHIFMHLAHDPALRRRIRNDPASIPKIVEEMVRFYTIGISRRRVVRDIEFAGCSMKAGDQIILPLGAANRDPERFVDGDRFDPDREGMGRHLGFAAGPHMCLGMHLARLELGIALEEWHKVIPDYTVKAGTTPHAALTDFMYVLEDLQLVW